jgi:hypothetical protein
MRASASLLVLIVAACSTAMPASSGSDARQTASALDSLDARFNRWVVAGQLDSIVNVYYAADATLLIAGAQPIRGREAIRAVYEGFYKAGSVRGAIKRTSLVADDSLATDIGHYDLEIRSTTDTSKVIATDHGNYITAFVRRDGTWQAIYDSNVSDIPAPAPPANAKK